MRSDTKLALAAALAVLVATPAAANVASAPSPAADLGMGAASGWLFFLVLGAAAVVVGVLFRMSRGVSLSQASGGSYRAAIGDDPFEARVAARLAELQNSGDTAKPVAIQPPAPAGFGRKGV